MIRNGRSRLFFGFELMLTFQKFCRRLLAASSNRDHQMVNWCPGHPFDRKRVRLFSFSPRLLSSLALPSHCSAALLVWSLLSLSTYRFAFSIDKFVYIPTALCAFPGWIPAIWLADSFYIAIGSHESDGSLQAEQHTHTESCTQLKKKTSQSLLLFWKFSVFESHIFLVCAFQSELSLLICKCVFFLNDSLI